MKTRITNCTIKHSLFTIFLLALLLGVSNTGIGQTANNYTFATGTGAPLLTPSFSSTIVTLSCDDCASSVITFGFNFKYEGTTYTQFSVNSNGLMKLGSTAVTTQYSNSITDGTNVPKIMPLWDDLNSSSDGGVFWGISGTSPNRILVVDYRVRNTSSGGTYNCRFQVCLYETTNVIRFVYGSGTTPGSFSCGIGGITSTNYQSVTTSTHTSSNSSANNSNSAWPGSGRYYSFTAPTTPSLSVVPNSLAFGYVPSGGTSAEMTYSLSGTNLTPSSGNITITPPANFEVSLTSGGGFSASAINKPYSGGALAATTIYTRFKPTAPSTNYNGNITNAGGGATQNVAVSGTSILTYCTPTYTYACSSADYINNFSTSGGTTNITNNNTGCNGQTNNYIYYSSQTVTQSEGSGFNISVQSGSSYAQGFAIWIDWNENGVFTDLNEAVWTSVTTGTTVFTGTINVPSGTATGTKRMRVRCVYGAVPTDPCATYSYGETEDYNVAVTINIPTCDYNIPYLGNNSITTSTGYICDHGGTSDYDDDANGFTVINPVSSGNSVKLTFTHFSTESGWDFVRVYDGTGTGGTLLLTHSGATLPSPVTSPSGTLTLEFTSDGSNVSTGFRAAISNVITPTVYNSQTNQLYVTIQEAINAFGGSVTGGAQYVEIRSSSTYNESVSFSSITTSATNTLTVKAQTGQTPIINGGTNGSCIKLVNTNYLTLQNLSLTGATATDDNHGIWVGYSNTAPCNFLTIQECKIYSNGKGGIQFSYYAGNDVTIKNCLIYNNGGDAIQVYNYSAGISNLQIINNTIFNNNTAATNWGGIVLIPPSTSNPITNNTIKNNIIQVNGNAAYDACFVFGRTGYGTFPTYVTFAECNYNNLYYPTGYYIGWINYNTSSYNSLSSWQTATGLDANSISNDPLFVNAGSGDFHIQSTYGAATGNIWPPSANPTGWLNSGSNSPSIDLGNPSSAFANEPNCNGGRINQGCYGNTVQASKSNPTLCCSPITLTSNTPVTTSSYPTHYQYTNTSNMTAVVAIAPHTDDHDIYVYDAGCQGGNIISSSTFSSAWVDYVVGYYGNSSTYYPSATFGSTGTSTVEFQSASSLNVGETGSTGIFDYTHAVEIYEVYLTTGITYNLELDVVSGGCNLGFGWGSPVSGGWLRRSEMVNNIDNYGVGLSENSDCWTCPTTGYYAIVIFNNRYESTANSDYTFRIYISTPSITSQPSNSGITYGDPASFTVATTNGTSYLWEEYDNNSWTPLSEEGIYSGVNSATLQISQPTVAMDGYKYRCVVSGACSPAVTSDGLATLTVVPKSLSVTANSGQYKYETQSDPVFTYTASGFVSPENESVLSGALSRVGGESEGFYAITLGSLTADNYSLSFTPANFEIKAAYVLNITTYLQGVYTGSGLMNTILRTAGQLSNVQPFNTPPWSYTGTETLPSPLSADVVDWVLVERRSDASSTFVERKAALLYKDGSIRVSLSGSSSGGDYVVVWHRNHMPVMSAGKVSVPISGTTYDLTASVNLYGTNPAFNLGDGNYAMIAGDVTHNGVLHYSGPGNDRGAIIAKIAEIEGSGATINSVVTGGYWFADVNLNNELRYIGGNDDRSVILTNLGALTGNYQTNSVYYSAVPGFGSKDQGSNDGPFNIQISEYNQNISFEIITNEPVVNGIVDNIQFTLAWKAGDTEIAELLNTFTSDYMLVPQGEAYEVNGVMHRVYVSVTPVELPEIFNEGDVVTVLSFENNTGQSLSGRLWIADNDFTTENNAMYYVSVWGNDFTGMILGPATGMEEIPEMESVELYPNPVTKGEVNVAMNLAKAQEVTILVTDMQGKLISTTTIMATAGLSSTTLDLDGLFSGVYFVRISGDNLNTVEKLIVK